MAGMLKLRELVIDHLHYGKFSLIWESVEGSIAGARLR